MLFSVSDSVSEGAMLAQPITTVIGYVEEMVLTKTEARSSCSPTTALDDKMLSELSTRGCSSRVIVGEWVRVAGRTARLLVPLEPMDTAVARQQHG